MPQAGSEGLGRSGTGSSPPARFANREKTPTVSKGTLGLVRHSKQLILRYSSVSLGRASFFKELCRMTSFKPSPLQPAGNITGNSRSKPQNPSGRGAGRDRSRTSVRLFSTPEQPGLCNQMLPGMGHPTRPRPGAERSTPPEHGATKSSISKTLSATPRTTSASDVATFPDRLRHVQSFTRFRSKPARGCGCLAALRPPRHLRAGRLRCSPTSLTKFLFLDNGRSTRGAEIAVHALLNRCSQFDSNAAPLFTPIYRS